MVAVVVVVVDAVVVVVVDAADVVVVVVVVVPEAAVVVVVVEAELEVAGMTILQNIPSNPTGHIQMARFGPSCVQDPPFFE